jgi:hypothetical protein
MTPEPVDNEHPTYRYPNSYVSPILAIKDVLFEREMTDIVRLAGYA